MLMIVMPYLACVATLSLRMSFLRMIMPCYCTVTQKGGTPLSFGFHQTSCWLLFWSPAWILEAHLGHWGCCHWMYCTLTSLINIQSAAYCSLLSIQDVSCINSLWVWLLILASWLILICLAMSVSIRCTLLNIWGGGSRSAERNSWSIKWQCSCKWRTRSTCPDSDCQCVYAVCSNKAPLFLCKRFAGLNLLHLALEI